MLQTFINNKFKLHTDIKSDGFSQYISDNQFDSENNIRKKIHQCIDKKWQQKKNLILEDYKKQIKNIITKPIDEYLKKMETELIIEIVDNGTLCKNKREAAYGALETLICNIVKNLDVQNIFLESGKGFKSKDQLIEKYYKPEFLIMWRQLQNKEATLTCPSCEKTRNQTKLFFALLYESSYSYLQYCFSKISKDLKNREEGIYDLLQGKEQGEIDQIINIAAEYKKDIHRQIALSVLADFKNSFEFTIQRPENIEEFVDTSNTTHSVNDYNETEEEIYHNITKDKFHFKQKNTKYPFNLNDKIREEIHHNIKKDQFSFIGENINQFFNGNNKTEKTMHSNTIIETLNFTHTIDINDKGMTLFVLIVGVIIIFVGAVIFAPFILIYFAAKAIANLIFSSFSKKKQQTKQKPLETIPAA